MTTDRLLYATLTRPVREYGCVRCQTTHRRGIDAEYEPHLWSQSKHGWSERPATPGEVLRRLAELKGDGS